MTLEFGLDTFGDITANQSGPQSAAQVIRDTLAEAVLADEVGLNYFGLGEHHRPDYAISSMEPLIATILAKTKSIHAGTSVTVLSSDDPIRLYQRFATLEALAPGRAEITIGRGSFTESFPLFGYDLEDYETLFSEKAQLLHALLSQEKITFRGHHRTALQNVTVYPRPEQPLQVWRGVGGSPDSVLEAAAMDMPLVMAIIGGNPARFAPLADLYRKARAQAGGPELPLSVHSPGHIAPTDEEAKERFFPAYAKMHDLIGRTRGWPPFTRAAFEQEIAQGSLYVGSPETVAQKIARTMGVLGLQRFTLKYSAGPQDPAHLRETIALYGTEVAPRVRALLAEAPAKV